MATHARRIFSESPGEVFSRLIGKSIPILALDEVAAIHRLTWTAIHRL